jgi:helicase required for RNAi-mediated heterochromatin assembly 1
MDLSSLEQKDDNLAATQADPDRYINIDVLRDFPQNLNSSMDKSQMSACEKMLTSRIAIVQGPPGTGKTFTSVSALRVMNENLGPKSLIVVAAQTNHALDQLLNHVLTFEQNILRLGGRSNKANKPILERTLYNLRQANRIPGLCIGYRQAHIQQANCITAIKTALETLMTENLLTADILRKNGLISESQRNSLYGNSDWEGEGTSGDITECKNCHKHWYPKADPGGRAHGRTVNACSRNSSNQPWPRDGASGHRIRGTS